MTNDSSQERAPGQLCDPDAEASVLGAVLVNSDALADVASTLGPQDFGLSAHQLIFDAITACDMGGRPVDAVTVADELERRQHLDLAGGRQYLGRLAHIGASAQALSDHVDIVHRRSRRRQLAEASSRIYELAVSGDPEDDKLLAEAEQTLFAIGQAKSGDSAKSMPQAVAETMERLAKVRGRQLLGHSTGFSKLDELTAGLQNEQLVTVAARPAMGKSALAINLARHIAETSGDSVYLASYEMSTNQLVSRMLSDLSEIPLSSLRRGDIPTEKEDHIARATTRLSEAPLLIDDRPPSTIVEVRSQLRRLARRTPLSAVVVDYLQLMSGDRSGRNDNRTEEVSQISRGLKLLAKELQVPVIALSQLSRGLENRTDRRPKLHDLRESGSIEQDSDMVWFLYRDAVYDGSADPMAAELIVAKQREGPTDTVPLRFEGQYARFSPSERVSVQAMNANGPF